MTALANQTWLPASIDWVPCFSDRVLGLNINWSCANLTVPVDYRDNSANKTTQIGLAKAHPNDLGTPGRLLFSGLGAGLSEIFSFDSGLLPFMVDLTDRQYDIILMDPRGTGWSNALTCGFTEDTIQTRPSFSPETWLLTPSSLGIDVQDWDAHSGPFCADNEDLDYLAHINTPNVARDLDLVRNLTGFTELDFFGFEDEGSILGATYAALFPDRVGRMVLDGVPDFEKWMGIEGNILDLYNTQLLDVDKVLLTFSTQCAQAAQTNLNACQLASASLNSGGPANDILSRIRAIITSLALQAYTDETGYTYTYYDVSLSITNNLASPELWIVLASELLAVETLINSTHHALPRRQTSNDTTSAVPGDLPYFLFSPYQLFSGSYNDFVYPAVLCLDSNYEDIDNQTAFVSYLANLIPKNPFSYQGLEGGLCLGWPNLTAFNVEQYREQFPGNINNKIIVIGETNNPWYSYSGALATYSFIGSDNANFFVHDGLGKGIRDDPNSCTNNAMKAYFVNGTLPQNGTVCSTDHSGSNNVFLSDFLAANPLLGTSVTNSNGNSTKNSLKVGLGIGLGLGLPVLLLTAAIVFFKVRNDRRKKYQVLSDRNSLLPEFKSSDKSTEYLPEYIPLEESGVRLLRDLHT